MLVDLSVKDFLAKTASNEPVPGGGSISALNGALAASLTEMVANLTVGKKKYEDRQPLMQEIIQIAADFQKYLSNAIDSDSNAYNAVFEAFKLPKETEEEITVRNDAIQQATKLAAEIPLDVAYRTCQLMDSIAEVAAKGNKNAITDAFVAMMCARTAVLGAALNVRINLSTIEDERYVRKMKKEVESLEKTARIKENLLLSKMQI
jgi:formiminotetrahydrofolate cyclodeaminase